MSNIEFWCHINFNVKFKYLKIGIVQDRWFLFKKKKKIDQTIHNIKTSIQVLIWYTQK